MIFHFPKTGNDVITWIGVKNFNRKPQLVGGGEILARYTKNQLSKPLEDPRGDCGMWRYYENLNFTLIVTF